MLYQKAVATKLIDLTKERDDQANEIISLRRRAQDLIEGHNTKNEIIKKQETQIAGLRNIEKDLHERIASSLTAQHSYYDALMDAKREIKKLKKAMYDSGFSVREYEGLKKLSKGQLIEIIAKQQAAAKLGIKEAVISRPAPTFINPISTSGTAHTGSASAAAGYTCTVAWDGFTNEVSVK